MCKCNAEAHRQQAPTLGRDYPPEHKRVLFIFHFPKAIVHAVNVAAHAWGIEVLRYEIRDLCSAYGVSVRLFPVIEVYHAAKDVSCSP